MAYKAKDILHMALLCKVRLKRLPKDGRVMRHVCRCIQRFSETEICISYIITLKLIIDKIIHVYQEDGIIFGTLGLTVEVISLYIETCTQQN